MKFLIVFKPFFTMILFVLASTSLFAQEPEPLDSKEIALYKKLKIFQWEKSLTAQELNSIGEALNSSKDILATEALKVVAVHNLQNSFSEKPGKEAGPGKRLSPIIREIIFASKESSKSLEASLSKLPGDYSISKDAHGDRIKEQIANILVIQKVRHIRNGEATNIAVPESYLSEYDRLLLQYGALPADKAVKDLTGKIAMAKIAGSGEYNLVEVLNSYGRKALNEAVKYISDTVSLKNATPYGRLLLIAHISSCDYLLSSEHKTTLLHLLSKEDIKSKFFNTPVSLKIQTSLLEDGLR